MARSKEIAFHALREKDIAEAFHVTNRTVRNWVKSGCPINPDRSYSLFNVHEWLLERERAKLTVIAAGVTLEEQKLIKEIEVLEGRIEKQKIENAELRRETVSKYLYNKAITTLIEAFVKFLVDALKRNIIRFRAIPDELLPKACDEFGIQATKHLYQTVKRVEQDV